MFDKSPVIHSFEIGMREKEINQNKTTRTNKVIGMDGA